MCGDYYIGGREFDTLSDLIGYYINCSDLLKSERLIHPVPPVMVCTQICYVMDVGRYGWNKLKGRMAQAVKGEVFLSFYAFYTWVSYLIA